MSIVAFFDKNKKESTAFRSELDALPIQENKDHLIRSKNDFMHACGHDIHTSALLALCEYIDKTKFDSNIVLIFQSKEETGLGSKDLVNSNILQDLNVTKIIAMHVWPNLEFNTIYSAKKLMCGSYELDITINGKSTHVSSYKKEYDPINASFLLYKKLYKNKKYYINHLGIINSGIARNISANNAKLNYTIRFKNNKKIKEKISKIKVKTKCIIDMNFTSYYPPIDNDKKLLQKINHTNIRTLKAAEDFGYYGNLSKTVYLLYGLGKGFNLHTENFTTTKEQRKSYLEKLKYLLNLFKE